MCNRALFTVGNIFCFIVGLEPRTARLAGERLKQCAPWAPTKFKNRMETDNVQMNKTANTRADKLNIYVIMIIIIITSLVQPDL